MKGRGQPRRLVQHLRRRRFVARGSVQRRIRRRRAVRCGRCVRPHRHIRQEGGAVCSDTATARFGLDSRRSRCGSPEKILQGGEPDRALLRRRIMPPFPVRQKHSEEVNMTITRSGIFAATALALSLAVGGTATAASMSARTSSPPPSLGFKAQERPTLEVKGTHCSGVNLCNKFIASCIGGGGKWVQTARNDKGQPTKGRCL
jgi:hypothetical protein